MSVKEATLYLADKGLVSVEGDNQDATGSDSNGAGKSTIINAILWCNYGEAGKSIKADSVVNKTAKKDCLVESTWQDEKATYRITRFRKHKVGKNSTRVELKTDEGWRDITKAGVGNVQTQINEILGQDYLVFQASSFAQQDKALDIPGMSDKQLKELLESSLPFDNLEEPYEKASKIVSDIKVKITEVEHKLERLEWSAAMAKQEGKGILASYKNYNKELLETNERIDNEIKVTKDNIKEAEKFLTDISKVDDYILDLKYKRAEIGNTDIGGISAQLATIEKRMVVNREKKDNPITSCYSCGQEVIDLNSYLEAVDKELEALEEEYRLTEVQLKEANENLEKASVIDGKISELQDKRSKAIAAESRIIHLQREVRLLEGRYLKAEENPYKASLMAYREDYANAKEGIKEQQNILAKLNEDLELQEQVAFTFSPKGMRYHMLETVAPELTQKTNEYLNVLTDGAFKANWSTVTKISTGEYREKFSITISDNGEEIEYGAISGGEKRKVKLSCFFALQDLIASQATKNIELWCGDEIDHALDAAGLERLMSLLDTKAKSKSTILVISHNQLRDWIPNFVVVTRKDNVSNIGGYLSGS